MMSEGWESMSMWSSFRRLLLIIEMVYVFT